MIKKTFNFFIKTTIFLLVMTFVWIGFCYTKTSMTHVFSTREENIERTHAQLKKDYETTMELFKPYWGKHVNSVSDLPIRYDNQTVKSSGIH